MTCTIMRHDRAAHVQKIENIGAAVLTNGVQCNHGCNALTASAQLAVACLLDMLCTDTWVNKT